MTGGRLKSPAVSSRTRGRAIRVSAAGVCRIELGDKLLVGLNRDRLTRGRRTLTPIGGVLRAREQAIPYLEKLGAVFEDERGGLRFRLPTGKLLEFDKWFKSRRGREISPARELKEELIVEFAAVPARAWRKPSFRLLRTTVCTAKSGRTGQHGRMTRYYAEIYSTRLNPSMIRHIRRRLKAPGSRLGLVSEDEILVGRSTAGTRLASTCRPLIGARPGGKSEARA